MTKDEAIRVAARYAQDNNYLVGEVEAATFLPASPPVRDDDEWSVAFENKMVPGSALVIVVDPRTRTAEVFVP